MLPLTLLGQRIRTRGGPLLIAGALLCLVLVSCRKDTPPQIIICQGDGVGGADCDIPGQPKEYWPPSKLKNSWITTQEDAAKFAAWCYQTDLPTAKIAMKELTKSPAPEASSSAPTK
jgi:hypothetical protein